MQFPVRFYQFNIGLLLADKFTVYIYYTIFHPVISSIKKSKNTQPVVDCDQYHIAVRSQRLLFIQRIVTEPVVNPPP